MGGKKRCGEKSRTTGETRVEAKLCLDGAGESDVQTGVGFLDHMLALLAGHSGIDLNIRAEGDLEVDAHHVTEDVGIVLGDVLNEALGDKTGISRFADVSVPMQDCLVSVALDICGRPHLTYDVTYPTEKTGDFDTGLVEEFMHAFVTHAGITMHVEAVRGSNSHHMAEAAFKALARALRSAAAVDPRYGSGIPSTKGTL